MEVSHKIVGIVQARMGSQRLPGKVLKVLGNRPVLEHILLRLRESRLLNLVVVATSTAEADKKILKFCHERNYDCFQGDELNVLSRFAAVIKYYRADVIVRITADCPFVDPDMVDEMLVNYKIDCDYYSNCHPCRSVPVGLDVEIFSAKSFGRVQSLASTQYEREHVTPLYYSGDPRFSTKVHMFRGLDLSVRLALDTQKDWEIISKIESRLSSYCAKEAISLYKLLCADEE